MHHDRGRTSHLQLDLRGLHCPRPIICCKAALHRLAEEDILQVTTDNLDSTRDLLMLLKRGGARFQSWWHDAGGFHFLIQKPLGRRTPRPNRQSARDGLQRLREWFGNPLPGTC